MKANKSPSVLQVGSGDFAAAFLSCKQVDSHHPILELAGSVNWNYTERNLYIVELNPIFY
jgi:hypothetical protein